MKQQEITRRRTKKGSTGIVSPKVYRVISRYPWAEYQEKIAAVAAISSVVTIVPASRETGIAR
jgi:hypothetical protein